jgi:hypothetical protein
MTGKTWMRWSLALALLAWLPVTATAQVAQVGQVAGEVKDAQGGVLPGVTLTLESQDRGFVRTAVTDEQGRFRFSQVPLGRYTVQASLTGFQPRTIQNNLVEAERETMVNVTLAVGGVAETVVVEGSTPIVDPTNQTQVTRLRSEEFEKMPVVRNYQALIGAAPGVVGTGNVNAHGSTTGNNLFLFDGVNTTDPTTGTFGSNLNFEAIQEVVVRTGAVSAEFGRASGAIVDVITKSGTNRFEGSYKFLMTNDDWNKLESTKNEVTDASLSRTKFDSINPIHNVTVGGPILRNRAWFFYSYDRSENTSPERQANAVPGNPVENFQQTTVSGFTSFRATAQLAPNHNLWVKYTASPTDGFVVDYTGNAAERNALTAQNQSGSHWAAQYSGVLGNRWTAEFMAATAKEFIDVVPFEVGANAVDGGAPYLDLTDFRWYNGGAFDGTVDRPRNQATGAMTYFNTWGVSTHQIKFGFDWQNMTSTNDFKFPQAQLFLVTDFNPVTRTFTPDSRQDYDTGSSSSKGNQFAFYARDKIQFDRLNLEGGLRFERQTGTSDVGVRTVDTFTVAPRLSASYALTPDNRMIAVGSYGRIYDSIMQGFSDDFAAIPQQTNYDNYVWNGSEYVFSNRFEADANTFQPNVDVTPRYVDELTVGVERQIGRYLGAGVRYVHRDWNNFVDDLQSFDVDGNVVRVVQNLDEAFRRFRGVEFTFDKRLSNRWSANVNYTFSKTESNHALAQGADFSQLGDFANEMCRQTTDAGLGDADGVFPCSEVQPLLAGRPTFDRPHMIKFGGVYLQPVGPVDLTFGVVGAAASKTTFSKVRTVNVLLPGTLTSSGETLTYLYEGLGSERVSGLDTEVDFSLEALYSPVEVARVGFKFEVFNLFNNESKVNVNNTAWCNSTATAACETAVNNFGKATARGSFNLPQTYRFTFLVRSRF